LVNHDFLLIPVFGEKMAVSGQHPSCGAHFGCVEAHRFPGLGTFAICRNLPFWMGNRKVATMPQTSHPSVGHVHLKVADLDRAIAFYKDILGFELTQKYGTQAAFLGAGGYHHHIGLNTWHSKGGTPPSEHHTGLYHSAFLYPDRASLAAVVKRVIDAGIPIDGAADHGVSEAIYLRDPDGNGVEVYRDRAPEDWPRDAKGTLAMVNAPLDLAALLAEATP
jgi:catechol 2,3-dioxygenase